jgi:hypothetical protein
MVAGLGNSDGRELSPNDDSSDRWTSLAIGREVTT